MNASQWHDGNQKVLMAAIDCVRLHLLGEANDAELHQWQSAEKAVDSSSSLSILSKTFQLTNFEQQVLILCAGLVLDSRIAQICSKNFKQPYLSWKLVLNSLPNAHWSASTPSANLRFWQLLRLDDEDNFLESPLTINERILHYLMGSQTLPHDLNCIVETLAKPTGLPPSQTTIVQKIIHLHQSMQQGQMPVIVLNSKDRQTCHNCAATAYAKLGMELLSINADDLPSSTQERLHLILLLERESLLSASAFYIDAHNLHDNQIDKIVAFANKFKGLLTIGSNRSLGSMKRPMIVLDVERPTATEQIKVWQSALGMLARPLNGTVSQLVRQFDMESSAIRVLGTQLQGELSGMNPDVDLIEDRLWSLCSVQSRPQLDGLAQRIESSAGWDDLILADDQLHILHEIVIHVYRRFQVYHEWGFANKNNRGLGIAALFSGDSGTGKTLAAEVIANHLHLDLYRVDLSSVVSKYIGETEKNLARIFDAAESMNAVLLFDEADALFGKRSEVKDSHDRYANIEVSYLLQRMESYRGLAILTTNLRRNLDTAFVRRLRFIVQFAFPSVPERARIWSCIFPQHAPLASLDFAKLAQLNVTGGQIKNIAMNAAFLAAHTEQAISMHHILQATQSEYQKHEKPLTNSEIKGWG